MQVKALWWLFWDDDGGVPGVLLGVLGWTSVRAVSNTRAVTVVGGTRSASEQHPRTVVEMA